MISHVLSVLLIGSAALLPALASPQLRMSDPQRVADILPSVEWVYIDTNELSDSEFKHFFMSRTLQGILARTSPLDSPDDQAHLRIPYQAFGFLGPRQYLVTFGGKQESPGCWTKRYSGGGRWDFSKRSNVRARVSTKGASREELLVLAELLIRMNGRRRQGASAWFATENNSYVLHIDWVAPSGSNDGRVSLSRTVGFDDRARERLKDLGEGVKLERDRRWSVPVDPPLDHPLVFLLNAGSSTAVATLERVSGEAERRRVESGIPANAKGVLAGLGTWDGAVVKVQIARISGLITVDEGPGGVMERYQAIVLDERWWGLLSGRVWVGEPIQVFNRPSPQFPGARGVPLGTVKVGDIMWVSIGPPIRGWRLLGHGVHVKE